ncbi:BTAD domain-containing putative transcriptional regulator [Actinoplanes sp. N902-109]|uniref:AfsR/SARP family transcriptional regulator n=1 Tax=Actinoplanes sp. (strain N902-109) TaxID=649831 RepID=UPI0003296724|nr:BTAD domain-containing putative transcriptional regulator [Actinoplanes sp. N902-109]AGL19167.1 putative AfsR family transcriptional regulator [Actinoplanes sp. N902-109]
MSAEPTTPGPGGTDVIRFDLLGAVRGWRGPAELDMGSPQQQAMLAALLLQPRGAATLAELRQAVWGDIQPAKATNALRNYAWRWRRTLAGDGADPRILASFGDGYQLLLPEDAVDVRRAEMLADRAEQATDAQDAQALLTQALQLWHGEALAGVPGPYAGRQRHRLTELRLALLEQRLALDIDLGRAARSVPELLSLSADHPTRERPYLLLMRALQATGRAGEAAAVFPAARRKLIDLLGIEPSADMVAAHQRLLAGDELTLAPEQVVASTAPAPPAPAQVPADTVDFTGRTEVTGLIVDKVTTADRTSLPVVVVVGMGGIGKSTVARHVAGQVKAHFPDGQLYARLSGEDAMPTSPETVLAGFLCALGADHVPDDLDSRSALFRSITHDRRLLVVLDDAHSHAQLAPLLPGGATCSVLITSRSRLPALTGAVHADLDVFSEAEALHLLTRVIGADRVATDPAAARDLVTACGLLPLAVRIVAARLAARPAWTIAMLRDRLTDERRRLGLLRAGDLDVSATFLTSWQPLDAEHQRALALLAGTDMPDFALDTTVRLVDRPESDVEDVLEHLVDLALLESAVPERYHLHPLVRAFTRSRQVPGDRATEEGQGRTLEYFLATAVNAFHWAVPADPVGETLAAGSGAGLPFAGRAAAAQWVSTELPNIMALVGQLATAATPVPAAVRTAVNLMIALLPFGPDPRAAQTTELVTALCTAAERSGDEKVAGRAHFLRGNLATAAVRREESERETRIAVELCRRHGDLAILRQALNDLGLMAHNLGRYGDAIASFEEAIGLARRLRHRSGELMTTVNAALSEVYRGRSERAETICRDALTALADLRDDTTTAYARYVLGLALFNQHRYADARSWFTRCLELCTAAGLRVQEARARYRLADALRAAGDLAAALDTARQAVDQCRHHSDERDQAYAYTVLARAQHALGEHRAARDNLRTAHAMFDRLGLPEAAATREQLDRWSR